VSSLPIIIAIAAAAVVLLVLVTVLVSRRRKAGAAADEPPGSFLGSRPQDTFAGLGEPETPTETADDEFRLDWGHAGEDVAAAPPAARDAGATAAEDEPAGPDEGEPSAADESEPSSPDESAPAVEAGDGTVAEAGDETPAATGPLTVAELRDAKGVPAAQQDAVAGGEAAPEAPGEPPIAPPARRMVPLSDIIVTTSRKMVDLDDPEVRRMLTELVRYEIDQASEFSAAGQTVDAILQLTEAEKVSRTLGMDETAARIKTMMRELRD
jgi:hypothetical protein